MKNQLKITQIKSIIGKIETQKRIIKTLGLRRINHSVIHNDIPSIRGMIHDVRYLVKVEEVKG